MEKMRALDGKVKYQVDRCETIVFFGGVWQCSDVCGADCWLLLSRVQRLVLLESPH